MTKPLTLYKDASYRGGRLTVTSNIGRLAATHDLQTSSVRMGAPAAFFTGQNYSGEVTVLTRDTARLSNIRGRNINNAIRSIRYQPLRLRLNITVGVDDESTPAKSLEEVAEQVSASNELFSRWGIEFEAHDLRVIQGLSEPMTAAIQDELIGPHLADDAVNILFFRGTQWQPEKWRWIVESVQLAAKPGSATTPTAELFSEPNFRGTRTVLGGSRGLTQLNTESVRSVRLGDDSIVTLFDQPDQDGTRLDLFSHEPDTANRHAVRNWWPNRIGHCCHGPASLIRNNQGSGRLTLAHELGHWMGLPHVNDRTNLMFPSSSGGTEVTVEQAERVWKEVLRSTFARRALV